MPITDALTAQSIQRSLLPNAARKVFARPNPGVVHVLVPVCKVPGSEFTLCKFTARHLSYTYPLPHESSRCRAHGYTHVSDSPRLGPGAAPRVISHGPASNCA